MRKAHRHLALLLGFLGLLGLLLLAPRSVEFPSTPFGRPQREAAPAPGGEAAAAPASPTAPNATDRVLTKSAQQKLAKIATPITTAPAGAGGDARFVMRDRSVSAFFTPRGVALALLGRNDGKRPSPSVPSWGLHWGVVDARDVEPIPEGEQASKVNVLKGRPEEWQVDQKSYARVAYDDVKPGVRMTVESVGHGVKYSLSAAKASDVSALRLHYAGAAALHAAEDGKSLEISTGAGRLREDGLVVTQAGRPIEASYQVTGQDEYAIVLHGADPDEPVEVDPVIGWSTYLGGTLSNGGGSDYGQTVKVDGAGSMYVAGYTYSGDFPSVAGHYDISLGGYQDGFIIKVNSGGAVVWATYVGGGSYEEIRSLALDGASPPNVYIAGYTDSVDFPIVGSVVDSTFVNSEAFVARISSDGGTLNWSTFLGGTSSEYAQAVAVDSAGTSVWVAGYTYSSDFPTFAGFDNSASSTPDGFIAKLNVAAGPTLTFVYSSYVGGSDSDYIFGMAVDGTGAAYLTGYTYSTDFPLAGIPYDSVANGGADVFVVKVKPAATALDWGTYVGGGSTDVAYAIALDAAANVYVTGYTYSASPTPYPTPGGVITSNSGSADAFLTKLNGASGAMVFSSYLGGTDYDVAYGVVVDSAGRPFITGYSYSTAGFPIGNAFGAPAPTDSSHNGGADIFVTAWQPAGSSLWWSTWLGGSSYEIPYAMAIDASNNVYLTGETSSSPAPALNPFPLVNAFDTTLSGGEDAYLIRLSTTTGAIGVSTYVGGANQVGDDYGRRVAADATGALYVTGITYASNFPTTGGALQTGPSGSSDLTVTKYSNAATPSVVWSTYLGGSSYEEPAGIGVDPTNSQVYIVGYTGSADFPMSPPAGMSGFTDTFVTKLLSNGTGLAWSRFLGGSSDDYAQAIDVNASGAIVVTGYTYSGDYPLSGSTFQALPSTLPDAFVTLLPANGVGITWSTYLGGTSSEYPYAAAFNAAGTRITVAGYTYSTDFPVSAGATQPASAGNSDMFVSRFDPTVLGAAQLEFSTYFGGPGYDNLLDMDLGPGDNMFLLGSVYYAGFPTTTGPPYAGSDDAVVVKIGAGGSLLWSRYLGGSSTDYPQRLRVDAGGSPIVTGYTYSINFPVQGAFQASLAGNSDVFVTKIDTSGGSLDWSSYLGGTNSEYPYGLAVFDGGTVFVVGETYSSNFPTLNPTDGVMNGAEFFVTRIDNSNPSVPSSLAQYKLDGTTPLTPVGAWSNQASFIVKATLGDLDDDTVALQVEVRSIDVAFTGTASATGSLAAGGPSQVTVGFPGGTQQFHWQARTIDVHGRTSAWVAFGGNSDGAPPGTPAARDVGRDILNPSIATLTPTSGSTYTTAGSPIQFTGTFSDTGGSGVSSVSWSIAPGGQSGGTTLNSPVAGQWTSTSIPLAAGVNTITFTVTDAAGNTPTGTQVTVTYDTTIPVTNITGPAVPPASFLTGTGTSTALPPTGTITLDGNSTDNFMVSSVSWSNSTGGSGSASLGAGTTSRSWQVLNLPVSPGANTISVITYDGANNPSTTKQIVINYDNQPPSVNITSHANGFTTTAATLQLIGSASDQAAPYSNSISSVTWSNSGGGSGGSTLNSPGAGQYTTTNITLAAGANVITVTATDGVPLATRSNLNLAQATITVYKDTAAPGIVISSPASSPFTTGNATITVSGTASDDLNVSSVTYTNSAAIPPSTVFPTILGPGTTSRTWSADVSLALGTNNLIFTVTDGVSQTQTANFTINYDNTAPSILVSNPATATTVVAASPITVNGTATASGVKTITGVTVENLTTGVQQNAGTSPWTANVALVIGTNTIQIIATDSVALTTTVNRTVILDPTAPVVTITGPTGAATYSSPTNSVVLSGVATDNRSIASMRWSNTTTGTLNQAISITPGASVNWTTTAIPLNPTDNTILVRATDDAGNFHEDTITVTYDATSPGITITSPTSAATHTVTGVSVALGGNASDNFQLQSVTWVNAATGLSGAANAPLASWTTPLISLNPGANVITVLAIDAAGNNQTDSITVYRDTAPPAIAITSPTTDPTVYTSTGAITLGGTASDDIQVATVTWSINTAVIPASGGATGTTAWSIPSIPLALGSNTITVTATDGAGQSQNDVITVVYDPTAPSVLITTPGTDPFSTTVTPVSLVGMAGDNIGVTEVTWANTTTGGSGVASGTDSWTCLAPLTSGSNLITVTSTDAAGNTASDTITVIYDPAAPLISITSPTSALSIATSTTPITIGGSASDDVGVASVDWSSSGAVVPSSGTAAGTDTWSFNVDLAPGENVITVVATDGVGRTGTAFLTIIYDPTAPTVTVTTPTTDPIYLITQPTVTLSGVANDNLALQSVTWTSTAAPGGTPVAGLGAWSISNAALIEGSNLFTITATDSVNNTGSSTLTVIYDGTNPLVDVVLPDNTVTYVTTTRPLPVSGTASDNLGLAGVSWSNDRGGGGAVTVAGGNWNTSVYLYTGINVITFTAVDDHGRTTTDTLTVDYTPENSSPSVNITTPATAIATSATQVLAMAGVSNDNVGVVGITWKNQTTGISGGAVPATLLPLDFSTWTANVPLRAGPNVIVVTAVDDAGNTATASVTVTFTPATSDTTPPIVTITAPTNLDLHTETGFSPLAMTASVTDLAVDDTGVAGVYWTNSLTGGDGTGTPAAGSDWTFSVGLALGTNVITVTAVDAAGNSSTDFLVVSFIPAAPDGVFPVITIVNPPTGTTYSTSVGTVTLTGTSSDDTAVATVVWVNGATTTSGSAEGTTAWTAVVPLQPGINVLTMRVYDTSGNVDTDQVTVVYTPPPPPPEIVPAGSCGLLGLDALLLLVALAALRRSRFLP